MLLTTTIATSMLLAPSDSFNFDFEGGTMKAWAAAVTEVAPQANIVMGVDPQAVDMPPMHLKAVSVDAVMAVCDSLSHQVTCEEIEQDDSTIWVIRPWAGRRDARPTVSGAPRIETTVFAIPSGFRAPNGPATLIAAIQAVYQMGATDTLDIKLVPGTDLLAVHGTDAQIDLAQHVIEKVGPLVTPDAAQASVESGRLHAARAAVVSAAAQRRAASAHKGGEAAARAPGSDAV